MIARTLPKGTLKVRRRLVRRPLKSQTIKGKLIERQTIKKPQVIKEPTRKRQIVHLGNVGDDRAYRSKMLAQRFSNFEFHGIDLKGLRSRDILHSSVKKDPTALAIREPRLSLKKPDNLKQTRADFIKGLSRFPDNSVDIITSDFAVGYYKKEQTHKKVKANSVAADNISSQYANIGSDQYAKDVINLVHQKLRPNGKFITYYYLGKGGSQKYFKKNVELALKQSNFKNYNIEVVNISKIPPEYRSLYTYHLRDCKIFRVVARK